MSTVHKSWMLNHSAACQRNVFVIGLFPPYNVTLGVYTAYFGPYLKSVEARNDTFPFSDTVYSPV